MEPKRREHPRYAHEASVSLVGPDGTPIAGHTANVSRGGVCANLEQPIADGADVEVDITLVFDEETQSEPLRVPARVVWCTQINDHFQVGITFKPLGGEAAEYLTMFLRYLDDGERPVRTRRESTLDKRFG